MSNNTINNNFYAIFKKYDPILLNNKTEINQALIKGIKIMGLEKKTNNTTKPPKKGKRGSKPPQWFSLWLKQFNAWTNHVDAFIDNQQKFNSKVSNFMVDQQKFNKLVMKRLDNLVSKNNLKE